MRGASLDHVRDQHFHIQHSRPFRARKESSLYLTSYPAPLGWRAARLCARRICWPLGAGRSTGPLISRDMAGFGTSSRTPPGLVSCQLSTSAVDPGGVPVREASMEELALFRHAYFLCHG